MTDGELLKLTKQDLKKIDSRSDEYLMTLVSAAKIKIAEEGVQLDLENVNHCLLVSQYAAYLFRKRAAPETAMPRFLRYGLNNLLLTQKGGGSRDI